MQRSKSDVDHCGVTIHKQNQNLITETETTLGQIIGPKILTTAAFIKQKLPFQKLDLSLLEATLIARAHKTF